MNVDESAVNVHSRIEGIKKIPFGAALSSRSGNRNCPGGPFEVFPIVKWGARGKIFAPFTPLNGKTGLLKSAQKLVADRH